MKCRWISWSIVVIAYFAHARDPFSPPDAMTCLSEIPRPVQWRLQGIIGRKNDYRGWLLSPQGQSLTMSTGDVFPLAPWFIDEIGPMSVMLSEEKSCRPGQYQLTVKGPFDDKDIHHVNRTARYPQPRQ
ncbi:HofP DNA utilization family protein [[Pantoea] beijingensis]|uniref:HofP DNA utilization family protein n=1 Tax=[Pantoea] beijingensis TaxID=1324864 RepID=UPI000FE37008|nr:MULTISPECIES: HofP DNA utilization family protein [Erwiniaceae]